MIKKLLNMKMRLTKNQKGLTLIELLVVIVILGIIAAIAIPAVMGNSQKAIEKADAQSNAVLLDAAKRYYAVEGAWPTASTGNNAANTSAITQLVPKYLDSAPTCSDSKKTATFTFTAPNDGTAEGSTAAAGVAKMVCN